MKLLSILVALAMIPLVPIPGASAQAPGAHLLSDDRGDAQLVTGAGPTIPLSSSSAWDAADLLWLDVVEDDDAFVFTLAVASMTGQSGGEYEITWSWRDVNYLLSAQRGNPTFGGGFQSAMLFADDGGGWQRIAPIPMTSDATKGTMTMPVQKVFVLDGSKHAPNRGDAIMNVQVMSIESDMRFSVQGEAPPGAIIDHMPNTGEGAKFTSVLGDIAQGHLAMRTTDRVRVSNGGATTFIFQATIHSNASYADDVKLTIGELPEQWNATVQSPVRVPANGEKPVTVLVSVPFGHNHGGFSSFNLTSTSGRDSNSLASIRFGVLHTPIPQPAGHHSEIYLHGTNRNGGALGSTFSSAVGFMNTEAKHDNDVDVQPNGFGNDDLRTWTIPLNPGLKMGLDFDLERTGTLEGAIGGKAQGTGNVSAKLYLVREKTQNDQTQRAGNGQGILLADAKGVRVTLDPQKPAPFKMTLTPTPESDYIAYAKGQNMVLVIRLNEDAANVCCFAGFGETLVTKDFKMVLPLNEYNDQLTGEAEASSTLDLRALGPVEKAGRPGTIMTYQFELVNGASAETIVKLDIAGNEAKLGSLVPNGRVTLAPQESRRLTLAVHIPSEAAEGQDLDVLVFAHAQDDPSKMSIARTKTSVSKGANATDDETSILLAARDAEKDAPGFELVALAAAVAGVALLARRKRG